MKYLSIGQINVRNKEIYNINGFAKKAPRSL